MAGKDASKIYSIAGGRIGLLSHLATSIADMGIECEGRVLEVTIWGLALAVQSGVDLAGRTGLLTHLTTSIADIGIRCKVTASAPIQLIRSAKDPDRIDIALACCCTWSPMPSTWALSADVSLHLQWALLVTEVQQVLQHACPPLAAALITAIL